MAREQSNLWCPSCGGATGVFDSRPGAEHNSVRRRRRCFGCGLRFTTCEMVVLDGVSPEGMADVLGIAKKALVEAESHVRRARENIDAADTVQRTIAGRL